MLTFIGTPKNSYRRMLTTSATDTSFPSKIPTATKPSESATSGVIDLRGIDNLNTVLLVPFGAGSDTDTFVMRVIGWSSCEVVGDSDRLWIPTTLGDFTCTLTTATGVASKSLVVADKFCDTIVNVAAYDDLDGITFRVRSPANDTIASILIDVEGHQMLEVTFDMTGATSGNCLAKYL